MPTRETQNWLCPYFVWNGYQGHSWFRIPLEEEKTKADPYCVSLGEPPPRDYGQVWTWFSFQYLQFSNQDNFSQDGASHKQLASYCFRNWMCLHIFGCVIFQKRLDSIQFPVYNPESLYQWFSTSLTLWPCNTVPHVVVNPNHKSTSVATSHLILLLLWIMM